MAAPRAPEAASSSSNSQHSYYLYDVFLSFRGSDTRRSFTDHLYTALRRSTIRTFRDDEGIKRGEEIEPEIEKAIKESKIYLIILSKDYASSSWCLDELLMMMELAKSEETRTVMPIFYDVDPSEVSQQSRSFAEAFARHQQSFGDDTAAKVEKWKEALGEVAKPELESMVLGNRDEAEFVQEIVGKVRKILPSAKLHVPSYVVGNDSHLKQINLWLQDGSDSIDIGIIYGTGGVGKTTLAKIAFNLNYDSFDSCSFLGDVRKKLPNSLQRLQRQLLSDILKEQSDELYYKDDIITRIKDALKDKKVLIVFDDVDNNYQINKIIRKWDKGRIKIIITTRNEELVSSCKASMKFKVERLNENESLELFSWHVFRQIDVVEVYLEESIRVVKYCGGLPLALEVFAASLSGLPIHLWRKALKKPQDIDDGKIQRILGTSLVTLSDS